MNFKKDYYQILGVAQSATSSEIKTAYRNLAKQYHPDANQGSIEFEDLVKEVNEAYDVLGNGDNKFVYDQYLKSKETSKRPVETEQPVSSKKPQNKRTYTKKTKVDTEERKYFKGKIFIKYRGPQDNNFTEDILRETFYKINPTEVEAIVQDKDIYDSENLPEDVKNAFIKANPFKPNINHAIKTTIKSDLGDEYYELDIKELTIENLVLENITKHEGESYGTVNGTFYGYLQYFREEEIETEVEECFGETGNVEERVENEVKYYRKEYYNSDCTTYWGNWIKIPPPPPKYTETNSETGKVQRKGNYIRKQYWYSDYKTAYWGSWIYQASVGAGCFSSIVDVFGLLIGVIVLIALLPQFLFMLPFIVIPLLFRGASLITGKWFINLLVILLLLGFIFSIFNTFRGQSNPVQVVKDQPRERRLPPVPVTDTLNDRLLSDTLIYHFRTWSDYNGNEYSGTYWIKQSALIISTTYKNELSIEDNTEDSYDNTIYSIGERDKGSLNGLYTLFDSIKTERKLDESSFAEMVVSFVQDIPYSLVLPNDCNPESYSDTFIKKYLSSPGSKCDGFQKFGINTPVEFMANLQGDCDTRTLLLYIVLGHYDYDVALLSSEFYSHSMLGINLPYEGTNYTYNNQRYVFWETTAPNVKPGILPKGTTNINYWRISLKSK